MKLVASVAHSLLPADAILLSFDVREGLSTLFTIDLRFVTEDPDVDVAELTWSSVCVMVEDLDGGPGIVFHGIIEEARYDAMRASHHFYSVRARPLLHGLAYRVRSRIFQQMSAVDIVKEVLSDAGIPASAVSWSLSAQYPVREYCVQYKESELAFVLRLLEDEGIYYWFEHSTDGHVLCLGDSSAHLAKIDGDPTISFAAPSAGQERVTDLVLETQMCHALLSARDWNWQTPISPNEAGSGDVSSPYERYEYPGGFANNGDGLRRYQNRLAEANVRQFVLTGSTSSLRLRSARRFSVADTQPAYVECEYLLLEVAHHFEQHARNVGDTAISREEAYRATFRAIPSSASYRPPRRTPRPRIFGKESAVVTGPPGEEIHVDNYGRIKVHFYWDREGKVDDTATCWVRVQQQNTSGSMILPRVGWEVEIGFLNGDPDRPVAMQKLYNRETMPPYALPGNKTQSSLQSSTSPGGAGTNEVRLQDGNGGMEAFVHASKDLTLVAGNDMAEKIGVDAKEDIAVACQSLVGASETVTIGGKQSLSVTGTCSHETVGAKTVSIGGGDDWGVGGNYAIACDGSRTETIGGLMNVLANHVNETFNASCTRTVGGLFAINSATAIVEAVGGSKKELVGGAKLELIAQAKAENVGSKKALVTGFVKEKTGADIGMSAKGAIAISAGGQIVESVGKDFLVNAKGILITTGNASMTAGGSKFDCAGGKLTINASSLGASGGPQLQLKGTINYKS